MQPIRRYKLTAKLNLSSRAELTRYAIKAGLISLSDE
jgi:DNA-binding CsgD family transcriptional regulator